MPVGTKGTESVKEREPKFLSAREQEYAEPFATGEGNNVARHSFTGLSKKRGNLCRKVNGGSTPDADSFDSVRNGTIPRPLGNQKILVKPILGLRIGLTNFWLFRLSCFFLDLKLFPNIWTFSTVRLEAGKNGHGAVEILNIFVCTKDSNFCWEEIHHFCKLKFCDLSDSFANFDQISNVSYISRFPNKKTEKKTNIKPKPFWKVSKNDQKKAKNERKKNPTKSDEIFSFPTKFSVFRRNPTKSDAAV